MCRKRGLPPFSPAAQAGAAGLEVLAVRAGGDLAVGVLSGQPDLEVVGLGRRETHVAGREADHAIGDLEPLEHAAGAGDHPLELVVARLGRREVHQLDLVELVLADQPAHVLAVRSGLAAEAGREGAVADRQRRLVEDLVAMQVGHRHLGGRDQVVVGALQPEEVRLELRQLAGAEERRRVDDVRRQHLGVAVLAGVEVEHERDERPLERGAGAEQRGEARSCDLGAALEVEDAELGPEVPVRLGREVEAARHADHPFDPVGALVGAARHRVVRQVRQPQLDHSELGVDRRDAGVERLDLALESADRRDLDRRVLAPRLEPADRLAGFVAAPLELLEAHQGVAPFAVERLPGVQRAGILAAVGEGAMNAVGVVAEQFAREHDGPRA